tara:strand:+ start:4205 stop:4831 length:627 start_codon:yes stop_codon:yes gene_type:complete
MIIEPKRFKKVIFVGLDLDLITELKKNKIIIEGYTSANPKKNAGLKYLGSIYDLKKIKKSTGILLTDSDIKLKHFVFKKFKKNLCTFFSKLSFLPYKKKIGIGSIIQANVFISENVKIGNCVKINVGSQIHHDVNIDDYCILAPKSVVLGDTKIEKNCFIGSSSTIRNKIVVASGTFLKMGSNLTKSTKKNSVYFGNPAKYVKKNENI